MTLIDKWNQMLADTILPAVPFIFLVVCVAFVAYRIFKRGVEVFSKKLGVEKIQFRPLENFVRYLLYVICLISMLGLFKFSIDGMWTMLSTVLGLVAIGFVAVWSVLSNMLCTVIILLFRPFGIGDEISFPSENIEGTVIDLTLIFTTLKKEDYCYQVPNNYFFQKIFKRKIHASKITLAQQLLSDHSAEEEK